MPFYLGYVFSYFMGAHYLWCICRISQQEYDELELVFQAVLKREPISSEGEHALSLWCKDPMLIFPTDIDHGSGKGVWHDRSLLGSFKENFRFSSTDEFALGHLLGQDSKFLFKADVDNVKLAGVYKGSPTAVFACAIGPEHFQRIPGKFLHFCIPPKEVSGLRKRVASFMEEPKTHETIRGRGLKFLLEMDPGDEDIDEILSLLPDSLGEAEHEQKGLLSFEFMAS